MADRGKRKRSIVISVLGVLLLAAAWMAWARSRPKPTPVETAVVGREDLQAKVTAKGRVQAKRKVDLSATIAGQVVHLAVNEGDRVKKGQFLLQIDATNQGGSAGSSALPMQARRQARG